MAVTIEDIMEAAAAGVLRAMGARQKGATVAPEIAAPSTEALVQSGFKVGVHIICGGFPDPSAGGVRAATEE
jgi:hypothetical protein